MVRHLSSARKHVVSLEKVCEVWLCLRKQRSKLVDQGKWLKKTRLGVSIVSNSSFLNGDVVIPIFVKQIIVSSLLVYIPLCFLVQLCCCVISCDVLYYLVDIVYIYL
jgi:hypothetical protein